MKANELRIGNWIFDDDGNYSKIIGFEPLGHSVRCDEDEGCILLIDIYTPKDIKIGYNVESLLCDPIPLTEEILLKCGFEKKGEMYPFYSLKLKETNGLDLLLNSPLFNGPDDSSNNFILVLDGSGKFIDIDNIEYLHQLQNLCHILTGKELEINL